MTDKVVVSGKVDTSKEGDYVINYSVTDSSGNKGTAVRKVVVKKPVISIGGSHENGLRANASNVSYFSNSVVENRFDKNGIY